jgi:hypothetical protein
MKKAWCGVAITLPVVLAGCGWSGYPGPDTARNPCAFADGRPPAGAAEIGPLPVGCANAANLGAMVADPGDVEHGKELAPADGERAALGVVEYQGGKAKGSGAPASSTTGAAQ